jgi:hypothetical protein
MAMSRQQYFAMKARIERDEKPAKRTTSRKTTTAKKSVAKKTAAKRTTTKKGASRTRTGGC